MVESYQQVARIRKATAIANVMIEAGRTWTLAREMNPSEWERWAEKAGEHRPSTATQAVVLGMLLSREVTPR